MKKFFLFSIFGIFLFLADSSLAFQDVTKNSPYYHTITELHEKGVIEGYSNGKYFKPKNTINRAEFVQIVQKARKYYIKQLLEKYPDLTELFLHGGLYSWGDHFSDVKKTDWFYDAVQYMAISGFINRPDCLQNSDSGCLLFKNNNLAFRPNDRITTPEALKIVLKAFHPRVEFDESIKNKNGIEPWYTAYFDFANELRLDWQLINQAPKHYITRQEVAELLAFAMKDPQTHYYQTPFGQRYELYYWEHPANFITENTPIANGKGRYFNDFSGMEVTILSEHNNYKFSTIQEVMESSIQRTDTITLYDDQHENWFAIAGMRKDNMLFYQKTYFSSSYDILHTIRFEYPLSLKDKYDPQLPSLVDGFHSTIEN